MLPKEKRLSKSRDFERVYQKGKRLFSGSYNINYMPNRLQTTRIGFVVGKKFSKKAVERNRAKRVFREAVKEIYNSLKLGFDIVIFVKGNDIKKFEAEQLKEELKRVLRKGEIIK